MQINNEAHTQNKYRSRTWRFVERIQILEKTWNVFLVRLNCNLNNYFDSNNLLWHVSNLIKNFCCILRGDTHMMSTLRGREGGCRTKMRCYRTQGVEVASVLAIQSLFFLSKKIGFAPWKDIILNQTLIYYGYIIDKKSSFWLWRQKVKPSFNDIIALFVGWIEHYIAWSIWMWRLVGFVFVLI